MPVYGMGIPGRPGRSVRGSTGGGTKTSTGTGAGLGLLPSATS